MKTEVSPNQYRIVAYRRTNLISNKIGLSRTTIHRRRTRYAKCNLNLKTLCDSISLSNSYTIQMK